ncbi:MAG: hypothetical protein EXS16_05050 [Gemmataceae bacterium]|nr:hypothetical protein [Gemmataceae bacterium]
MLTFPKQILDGLLDVTFAHRPHTDPFLIEVEVYPDRETLDQLRDDAAMVILARGVLPDILIIVLCPKGNAVIPDEIVVPSAHGMSELRLRIRVVNLWTLSAELLLATNDVGLILWVPLTQWNGPPEDLLRTCREKIVNDGPPREIGNLLAATRTMAEMRYNDVNLLRLLEEIPMTMEKVYNASPFIQRLRAESQHEGLREGMREGKRETSSQLIIRRLTKRFGGVPLDFSAQLAAVSNETQLLELVEFAYECDSLERFLAAMSSHQ